MSSRSQAPSGSEPLRRANDGVQYVKPGNQSPSAPSSASAVQVLQSLAHAERSTPPPVKRNSATPVDVAPAPSLSLLPVADYAGVFREYEQRTSLFSHTDVARVLWGQMNVACSVSILKQSILTAYDNEMARMQAARQECLQSTATTAHDIAASGLRRNSMSPIAESLIQGLLLASNRINRVTLSLFGHSVPPAPGAPPSLTTLPPYDMNHSPHLLRLTPIPDSALPAAGVPGVLRADELLHWSCGQDLKVAVAVARAAWGCSLACSGVTHATSHASSVSHQPSPAVAQWAHAREDAVRDLALSDDELRAAQGHSATLILRGSSGSIGTITIHGDGSSPITRHDLILAQHAADFAAPLLAATACAITNDVFALAAAACSGSVLQHVTCAASVDEALLAIRDAVSCVFGGDSVATSFFSGPNTLQCSDRPTAVQLPPHATGLLCFARESQQLLLVHDPLADPRYNAHVDVSAHVLPAASNGGKCALLVVPCLASSASKSVLGFIQIAREHASSSSTCCFSAVELRCIARLAASVSCLMQLMQHTLRNSSTLDSNSSLLSTTAKLNTTLQSQTPLSSSLLQVLIDRRDLALQLFRATAAPGADPRLHRVASMALAHADAPQSTSMQHSLYASTTAPLLHSCSRLHFVSRSPPCLSYAVTACCAGHSARLTGSSRSAALGGRTCRAPSQTMCTTAAGSTCMTTTCCRQSTTHLSIKVCRCFAATVYYFASVILPHARAILAVLPDICAQTPQFFTFWSAH